MNSARFLFVKCQVPLTSVLADKCESPFGPFCVCFASRFSYSPSHAASPNPSRPSRPPPCLYRLKIELEIRRVGAARCPAPPYCSRATVRSSTSPRGRAWHRGSLARSHTRYFPARAAVASSRPSFRFPQGWASSVSDRAGGPLSVRMAVRSRRVPVVRRPRISAPPRLRSSPLPLRGSARRLGPPQYQPRPVYRLYQSPDGTTRPPPRVNDKLLS